MWKLPFKVLNANAYSNIIFRDVMECLKRFGPTLEEAQYQLLKNGIEVGSLLIFKNQVIALPDEYQDQRYLAVVDVPGSKFDSPRPQRIDFA